MKLGIIIGFIFALGVALAALPSLKSTYVVKDRSNRPSPPRIITGAEVHAADIPAIVAAMARSTAPLRYAAFMFSTPDRPADAINLQVSVENGKIGFDWILLAPRNIEDREKFMSFVRAEGFQPVAETMNRVSYLRIESADAARIAADIVTRMYGRPANEPLGLFHEGFDWPQT